MRKVYAVVMVLLCIAFAGSCIAAESEHLSTKSKSVLVDRNNDGKSDGVDIYDEGGKVIKMGYDTNNDMVVDKWEATDDNTGLPIVVASDETFELR